MKCTIYKIKKEQELYLYLVAPHALGDLPDEIKSRFTNAIEVMALDIKPTTKLARVDTDQVLQAFERQGFYIQMPPADPTLVDTI